MTPPQVVWSLFGMLISLLGTVLLLFGQTLAGGIALGLAGLGYCLFTYMILADRGRPGTAP